MSHLLSVGLRGQRSDASEIGNGLIGRVSRPASLPCDSPSSDVVLHATCTPIAVTALVVVVVVFLLLRRRRQTDEQRVAQARSGNPFNVYACMEVGVQIEVEMDCHSLLVCAPYQRQS